MTTYASVVYDSTFVPVNLLDNVLTFASNSPKCNLHSFLTGEIITTDNASRIYSEVAANTKNKIYPTTDHMFISTECNGRKICYVSLDNSVRSNAAGHPLKDRLSALCDAINGMMTACVIFLSESCRASFDTNDVVNQPNRMSWQRIRRYIEKVCLVTYLGECANNEDSMAMGVSAFCTYDYVQYIDTVMPRHLCTGSGAVGIKFTDGSIVWGIHFPLGNKSASNDKIPAETLAMNGLVKLMRSHSGSYCAIGDFNTIPGKISDNIMAEIPIDMQFVLKDSLSFFGSYYDTISTDEKYILLETIL